MPLGLPYFIFTWPHLGAFEPRRRMKVVDLLTSYPWAPHFVKLQFFWWSPWIYLVGHPSLKVVPCMQVPWNACIKYWKLFATVSWLWLGSLPLMLHLNSVLGQLEMYWLSCEHFIEFGACWFEFYVRCFLYQIVRSSIFWLVSLVE